MKIDLKEIGYGAVEDAVSDIAGGAAEEKGEARGIQCADTAAGDEQPGDDSDDDQRAADEDYSQGGRGKTSEKTEGDAGIARVDEIEKTANDGVREVVRRAGFDPRFGGTVEENNDQRNP